MNRSFGSAHWLDDESVERIADGGHADRDAAVDLADEVRAMRSARHSLVESLRTAAEMLCERHGPRAADAVLAALRHIATADEIYPCPPTDTPPSAASGDPPPRARSSG
jgi:hypothetical protein